MKEFITLLIGEISYPMFAALFVFAMIGLFINLLIHATTRDQNSTSTPVAFSFKFLIWDNWKRIILVWLTIFISIRFASMIFDFETGNKNWYLIAAVLIGLAYDKLAEIWKEKTNWLKVRKDPPNVV